MLRHDLVKRAVKQTSLYSLLDFFYVCLFLCRFFINACKIFQKVQRSRLSRKIQIVTQYYHQNIHFLLVWNSQTELKFFYMQHIFVCLLLCLCVGFFFCGQFGAVLVCLIYLFILALNLIHPDENLKSMFAFLILIALFFLLVSIRCKL